MVLVTDLVRSVNVTRNGRVTGVMSQSAPVIIVVLTELAVRVTIGKAATAITDTEVWTQPL